MAVVRAGVGAHGARHRGAGLARVPVAFGRSDPAAAARGTVCPACPRRDRVLRDHRLVVRWPARDGPALGRRRRIRDLESPSPVFGIWCLRTRVGAHAGGVVRTLVSGVAAQGALHSSAGLDRAGGHRHGRRLHHPHNRWQYAVRRSSADALHGVSAAARRVVAKLARSVGHGVVARVRPALPRGRRARHTDGESVGRPG